MSDTVPSGLTATLPWRIVSIAVCSGGHLGKTPNSSISPRARELQNIDSVCAECCTASRDDVTVMM